MQIIIVDAGFAPVTLTHKHIRSLHTQLMALLPDDVCQRQQRRISRWPCLDKRRLAVAQTHTHTRTTTPTGTRAHTHTYGQTAQPDRQFAQ